MVEQGVLNPSGLSGVIQHTKARTLQARFPHQPSGVTGNTRSRVNEARIALALTAQVVMHRPDRWTAGWHALRPRRQTARYRLPARFPDMRAEREVTGGGETAWSGARSGRP